MGSLWNRSGTIERYADDLRAAGAQAFFFQGGTVTPLTVYRDAASASAFPSPVVADANGRWPDVFVPFVIGYDVQVKSADGVQLTFSQQIPNPNPVDQTIVIDPSATVQTGMIHFEFVNSVKTGFVRLNGRTMGNASSGGTERANADCSALFTYLWNNLTNALAPVSGGRGGSAAADFGANKTILLPDMRGAGPIGLDDMGSPPGGTFAGLTFQSGDNITPGSYIGSNGVTLGTTNMPAHFHTGSTSTDGAHTHTITLSGNASGTTGTPSAGHTHTFSGTTGDDSPDHTHSITANTMFQQIGGLFTGSASQLIGTGATVGGASNKHQHPFSGTTASSSPGDTHTHSISLALNSGTAAATNASAGAHSHTFTTSTVGGSAGVTQPFNNLGLSRLGTWFIKL